MIVTWARFDPGVSIWHIEPVQASDAPELALYRTLRRLEEHEQAGVLAATNVKVIMRLWASRVTVVSALLAPAWLERLEPQFRARPEDVCVHTAERPESKFLSVIRANLKSLNFNP